MILTHLIQLLKNPDHCGGVEAAIGKKAFWLAVISSGVRCLNFVK